MCYIHCIVREMSNKSRQKAHGLNISKYLTLSRLMIYGVARTIHPSGPLDGLLGGRFILSFLACTFYGLAKAVLIGWIVVLKYIGPTGFKVSVAMGLISALFLPQFLMSIYTTIGLSINSFKTIFCHIELLLLPTGNYYCLKKAFCRYSFIFTVTTFTFSKHKSSCNGKTDLRIRFSTPWTIVNCLLSTIIIALVSSSTINEALRGPDEVTFYLIIFTPSMVLHIIGVICTLSFIWFDLVSCCCCACWRGQEQVVVYDPDHPETSLVLRDGEIVERNDQREETQHAETDM